MLFTCGFVEIFPVFSLNSQISDYLAHLAILLLERTVKYSKA